MERLSDYQKVLQEFGPLLDAYWPYVIGAILGILTFTRSYMGGPKCPSDQRIDGKVVVITGASSGIGRETALELARRGAHVILAVRDEESGNEVAEKIRAIPGGKADVKRIDLSSLQSVREFAEKLGHFLLTQLLLPKLKAAKQGKVINVSAQAHAVSSVHLDDLNLKKNFTAREAFGQSKLALILMARHMSHLLKDTNVTINVVNPGLVRGTRHMRRSLINSMYLIKLVVQPWMWLLLKNPIQGAQTTVYVTVTSEVAKHSGKYFSDCDLSTPSENALNDTLAEKLYAKSLSLVRPYMPLPIANCNHQNRDS